MQRDYQRLDVLATRAQTMYRRSRLFIWVMATLWMTLLQMVVVFSTWPMIGIGPISYPLFRWLTRRLKGGTAYQTWRNARLHAEVLRIVTAFEQAGLGGLGLYRQFHERAAEESAALPFRRYLVHKGVPESAHLELALPILRASWLDAEYQYFVRTAPRREKQLKKLKRTSSALYTLCALLILVGLINHIYELRIFNNWMKFGVLTMPTLVALLGIFFSEEAESKDIEQYRKLCARYRHAHHELAQKGSPQQQLAIAVALANAAVKEVLEWWKAKR